MTLFGFETIEDAFDLARDSDKPVRGLLDGTARTFYPSGYFRSIPASFPLTLINPKTKDKRIIESWEGLGK